MDIPILNKLSFGYKVALCFSAILALTLSTLWLIQNNQARSYLQTQADEFGTTMAQQSADSIRELVLVNDLLSLNVVIDQLTEHNIIDRVTVYNVDNQVIATKGIVSSSEAIKANYEASITLQDAIAGHIRLDLNTATYNNGLNSSRYYFWAILSFSLLLVIAVSLSLSTHLVSALNKLISAIENPDEGSISGDISNQDEISRLSIACKSLLEKYQENRTQQLSLSGVQNITSMAVSEDSSKLMSSLLVIKVVNVNTAIELLHPNTLSKLLNEYYFYLKKAAKLYGGTLHRYNGESCLVSFDLRTCGEDHSINAVCCALLFQLVISKVNLQHQKKKSQALQFKTAIHSGDTFFSKDYDGGSQTETILGKSIDTAYLLCQESEPAKLLISETTYSQARKNQNLHSTQNIEITMPTDNMSFMAYFIDEEMGQYKDLLSKQCAHIVPDRV